MGSDRDHHAGRAAGHTVSGTPRSRHRTLVMYVAAVLLIAGGVSAAVVAASDQQHPPHLHPTTLTALPTPTPAGTAPTDPPPGDPVLIIGPTMPRSVPTHITIPAIGVNHDVRPAGLNPDGTLHTPPLTQVQWPVWYEYSPTPGELGPSVIVGHIDSATAGPGVFFRLGAMKAGDTISVRREDGSTARFIVYKTAEYKKTDFPTHAIYGDTDRAELRLISCGGAFNSADRSYVDDIVIYAMLTNAIKP
ncbi:MAG: class F sortase [Acidimicrobiales bacterium]